MNDKAFKFLSFSAALCMFFSLIEYAIPHPLPFLRIGLANVPIILGLYKLKTKDYFLLALLKVLLQSLVGGTFFSYIFVYSLCGTLVSAFFMWSVSKIAKSKVSALGLCVAGALGNNIMQIVLSYFWIFGTAIVYAIPLILIFGFVTSVILGLVTNQFIVKSEWFKKVEVV